jgi:hypothetical protein
MVEAQVEKVMTLMQQTSLPDGLGLLPTAWDITTGKPSNSECDPLCHIAGVAVEHGYS